jgi:DNA-dependent RNA polymerase auxiliary subunit epsilon
MARVRRKCEAEYVPLKERTKTLADIKKMTRLRIEKKLYCLESVTKIEKDAL